ncbi:MAG: restriction endonuclease subunit S [Bacteroidales bacterium]|nr:restriction endonuclease subunit S [Bacteroidales bacterium]
MKQNWTYKKFEDCLDKVKYTPKVPSSDYMDDGAFPIISQEEGLISGYWNKETDVFKVLKPVVIFGDHTRILKYVDFDFVLGADGVKILQPIEGLSAKFLLYYLIWCNIPSMGYSRHYKLLKELDIPVPPIETQSRIVSELDLLQSIIDKQQAQLKELDTLAQAVFYDMFGDPVENEKGWETTELNEVCDVRDGTHDSPSYYEEGYPLITSKNVIDGKISFDEVNYICMEDFDNISKRSKVDDGDIIMPMIGTIGKPVIVKKDREFAIKNVALIKFIPDSKVINVYIQAIMSSKAFDTYMRSKNRGGNQKFIALGDIRKLNVQVPPLSLQQSFTEKIESIEKQKAAISQSIAETQKLFDFTMDKYFG